MKVSRVQTVKIHLECKIYQHSGCHLRNVEQGSCSWETTQVAQLVGIVAKLAIVGHIFDRPFLLIIFYKVRIISRLSFSYTSKVRSETHARGAPPTGARAGGALGARVGRRSLCRVCNFSFYGFSMEHWKKSDRRGAARVRLN